MKLNQIAAAPGARKSAKRVGRGIGSGMGKTSTRGHKGQHARSGGYKKVGFEGGQMPLQRRVPKFGFKPLAPKYTAVRLATIAKLSEDVVDMEVLIKAGLVDKREKVVKVYLSGTITKSIELKGIKVTKGVKAAIEKAGGKVTE
ncbi:MAG: 50S ribosomal protein L15 [Pseudomonadota bacterium]